MNPIYAIDPGNEKSAIIVYRDGNIIQKEILPNLEILGILPRDYCSDGILIIEMVACYGMPVGKTIFETCVWIGRFIEAFYNDYLLVYRKDIKLHLCNSVRAKDTNIRQALIDKYGPPGTKKNPGKTYGISNDLWSALAILTYYIETEGKDDRSKEIS